MGDEVSNESLRYSRMSMKDVMALLGECEKGEESVKILNNCQ